MKAELPSSPRPCDRGALDHSFADALGLFLPNPFSEFSLRLSAPTNHLDLPAIERLQAALARFPGALLLVSHDDAFAAACTQTTWHIDQERLVEETTV